MPLKNFETLQSLKPTSFQRGDIIMPLNPSFTHNGISIERTQAPPPMGPLGSTTFGIVGTAPDADSEFLQNKPYRIANLADVAKLDTTGNEKGTLWRTCFSILRVAQVPIYVVIVPEGENIADTQTNIIGGVDANGVRTGLQVLKECPEAPTHIAAPGFSDKSVLDALTALGKKLFAIPVGDGPNTNDADALALSNQLGGEGLGYDALYLVDPAVLVHSTSAKALVQCPASAHALGSFARVPAWESPASSGGALIDDTVRTVDYHIMDKTTDGALLNKNGISYYARTSLGGFSLIGNRSATGRFINQVGLEYAIIRKLAATSQQIMAKPLSQRLMRQQVDKLNTWLNGQGEAVMGAQVLLHPELNTADNYRNGEWHIAINYHGYAPNEHMVYHLNEDVGIVDNFLANLAA